MLALMDVVHFIIRKSCPFSLFFRLAKEARFISVKKKKLGMLFAVIKAGKW